MCRQMPDSRRTANFNNKLTIIHVYFPFSCIILYPLHFPYDIKMLIYDIYYELGILSEE